ncbi:phosphate ABC transporter permease subunit PstC [Amycolatopsis roodepoortensis]|uniref:phosphate ABC transporter permease subunit PstC n=1 Tax=Amycolatopsis roodepoortensis TaxID=700274 RepID=UPI00214B64BF|nr:phosphate ABC transporter permease subunit PstC [Amycolatopsis roodepoortensis]UUV34503.1 phosphate ABC transporter permease subunit PstC [Amycolatopsis roodepoortensis]
MTVAPPRPDPSPPGTLVRRAINEVLSRADRAFRRVTTGAGLAMLGILLVIGFFLVYRSGPAFDNSGFGFFTTIRFDPASGVLGVLGLLYGTIVVALIAVLVAVPLSILAALFITEYSSGRIRGFLTGLVDLLAAIPSLLYGLWGFSFLGPQIVPVSTWLTENLGWFPLFASKENTLYIQSMFIAGLVVSLMVLPITTSVIREVFAQTPPGEKEAALALGSTRWGMVKTVMLPFGRGGIIGGSMLGLGRALGETIAVSLLLPQVPEITKHILQFGGATISGFIANNSGASGLFLSGLMAAGLVLFVFTLATNFTASVIISKSRSGAGVDA